MDLGFGGKRSTGRFCSPKTRAEPSNRKASRSAVRSVRVTFGLGGRRQRGELPAQAQVAAWAREGPRTKQAAGQNPQLGRADASTGPRYWAAAGGDERALA
jgi:hypothetical protein